MKRLLAVGILAAILGLTALSVWYVSFRLNDLFGIDAFWALLAGIAAAIVGSVATIVAAVKSASKFVGVLNVAGGYIFTYFVYTLLLLLLLHAVQLVWDVPAASSGAVVLLLAFLITAAGAWRASSFATNESRIELPGLRKEVSVMHISDVHLGHHNGREYLSRIVKETNLANPDIVVINGDLLDSNAALLPGVLEPLADFAAPVYYVGGNHEKSIDNEVVNERIKRHGARILHNEVIESHGLQLIGLDCMNADENTFDMHPSDHTHTIKSVLSGLRLNKRLPSVLMHHSPVGSRYAEAAGIGLMLSGHTHAGQLFPFTLLSEWIFPFNKGLHRQGKTKVLVSQGAGTYMLRVRIGTSNEINLLRLQPSAK